MEGRCLHATFSLQLLVSELLGQDLTSTEWRLILPLLLFPETLTDLPGAVSAGCLPIYSSLGQIQLGLTSPLLTTSDEPGRPEDRLVMGKSATEERQAAEVTF